jgi:hypothetical protein
MSGNSNVFLQPKSGKRDRIPAFIAAGIASLPSGFESNSTIAQSPLEETHRLSD